MASVSVTFGGTPERYGPTFIPEKRLIFQDDCQGFIGKFPSEWRSFTLHPTAIEIGERIFALETSANLKEMGVQGWMFCYYKGNSHGNFGCRQPPEDDTDLDRFLIDLVTELLKKEKRIAESAEPVEAPMEPTDA